MPRSTIPPSKSYNVNNGQAVNALQEKLNAAETETLNLVRQLEHLGFNDSESGDRPNTEKKSLSPFIAKTNDADVLQRNYETLVSRVCRNESTLQTLKLNLCNLQAQNQLSTEQAQLSKENLFSMQESHEKEKKKLVKDLAAARKECKESLTKRHEAEEASRRLSAALEEAVQSKIKLALNYEDLRNIKQKLNKQLAETREDLARELALRSSLEQSHNALMDRLKNLEAAAHEERKEIESFSKSCVVLKNESIKLNKEKQIIQSALDNSKLEIASKEKQIIKQIEEMQAFLSNLGLLKKENKALKTQLDELSKHTRNMKIALESAEKVKQGLLSRLEDSESIQQNAIENEQQRTNGVIKNIQKQLQKQLSLEEEMRQENEQLRILVEEKEAKLKEQEEVYTENINDLKYSAKLSHEELKAHHKNKDLVIEDKQSLLDEVNLAVEGISAENSRMQQELEEAKLEVKTITNEKGHLQLEIDKLLDRISFLEQHQHSQKTVESSLVELTEGKNQLAYENGRLQSQIAHLQQQIEAITDARSEVTHLKRANLALHSKVTSLSSAVSVSNVNQKRLENSLKQFVAGDQEKDDEIKQLKTRCEKMMSENQRYQDQLKAMYREKNESQQHLENKLDNAKHNNTKMASTIKSVMQSHGNLQASLEKLQIELGKKDTEILNLERGKQKYEESLKLLSKDMQVLQDQLVSMETSQLDRVAPLKSELEVERMEKVKLLSTIDNLHSTNTSLQNILEEKKDELEAKQHQIKDLQQSRKREKEIAAKNVHVYQDKIEKIKSDAIAESEREKKQASKEGNRLRHANSMLQSKVTELTTTCGQQQKQIVDLEETNTKYRLRITGQKTQLQQFYSKSKESEATNKKIKEMSTELEELEEVRNQYMMKNSEQMQTIASFLTQISELQTEMKNVVKGQTSVEEKLQKKEDQINVEKRMRVEAEKKYTLVEQELLKLQDKHEKAKEDVRNLSLQISQQTLYEVTGSSHGDRLSREQLIDIERQLQKERDHSKLMDKRMKRVMNSSSRFVEDLAMDVDESFARY